MTIEVTPEIEAKVVGMYEANDPTPENSADILQHIGKELEMSPNKVRIILTQAGVYKNKTVTQSTKSSSSSTGTKRVSKEEAVNKLISAIQDKELPVDHDIIAKLTGKAAMYFASLLK